MGQLRGVEVFVVEFGLLFDGRRVQRDEAGQAQLGAAVGGHHEVVQVEQVAHLRRRQTAAGDTAADAAAADTRRHRLQSSTSSFSSVLRFESSTSVRDILARFSFQPTRNRIVLLPRQNSGPDHLIIGV